MCGIGGILNFDRRPVDQREIRTMMNTMLHRGPDAEGFFLDQELALGHRRLSIIDLSDAANQPFEDASGRYAIVFNGEIYNYKEIKPLLNDYPFRTQGDTEVILAGYIRWGADCLSYLRGMFTIVIWDKEQRELFIARDRLGVKPLYYYQNETRFLFASEVRAILAVGNIERKLDRTAIAEYLRYQSVGFPFSPIQGIKQIEAGSWRRISRDGKTSGRKYWDPTIKNYDFEYTDKKQVEEKVRQLMLQSVKRRLVSDVPVAAFLSGGIDSSAIVGLMVEAGDTSPNTFNVSFDESAFDESKYADIVARKFNTKHQSVRLRPDVMLDELTNALDAMDTPSGDGINTYVVSKAIHDTGIRVALSGVGGDELFAGYPIFLNYIALQQKRWIWGMPPVVRSLGGMMLGKGEKKDRMRQLIKLPSPDIENSYPVLRQIISPANLKVFTNLNRDNANTLTNQLASQKKALAKLPFYSQVTAAEYIGYTQQTLLKDTDQMSMAHSLEVREPFFDQDLVEFVMSIPDHLKVPVYPKSLLVESLKPLLPDEIVHRKKQGFVFPWNDWMKNELRSFCDEHIKRMAERDFIHGDHLKYAWNLFLSGDKNVRWLEIWLFVVLNYWMEKNQVKLNKKRILIFTDWYEPGFKAGGPIQSCRNFVQAMCDEFDISVLTSDRDLGESKPYPEIQTNHWVKRSPGVKVYYANTKTLDQKKLSGLILEINPDFIYLNSMYSYRFSVMPLILSWRNKIAVRIVLAPRGMLQEGAMRYKTTKKKLFIRLLNFINLPRKIRFHATDDQEVKDIRKYFPRAKAVLEISNFSAPLPAESRLIEKIPGWLKAVYISRIIPKKNINFFLELLDKLPLDIQMDIDIYGEVEDPVYWEEAKRIISVLPENIRIHEHGAIPHEMVNGALGASHIFVLPSNGENYGHAIFEAWSASRPCLISDKTPWHHLKRELTGWDLPLDNKQAWLNALIEAAEWEQDSFDSWCRKSRAFASQHVDQHNLKQDYIKLFS